MVSHNNNIRGNYETVEKIDYPSRGVDRVGPFPMTTVFVISTRGEGRRTEQEVLLRHI